MERAAGLVVAPDGTWTVLRSGFGAEAFAGGRIPVRPFVAPPAYIGMELSQTIQVRPYEPVSVKCSLLLPVNPAEIDGAYTAVHGWLTERMGKERAEIETYAKAQRGEHA